MDTDGYIVLRNVIDNQTLDILQVQSKLIEAQSCFKINKTPDEYPFGDKQCPQSFSSYSVLCYEALMLCLCPFIEKQVGKELSPTYSYMRIYYKNSILNKHTDRPSCEYSASVCISIDKKPWDIFFKIREKNVCISLQPGDLIIYNGQKLEHWRDKYDGDEQIQAFLHYVDKNGKYSNLIYDKRPFVGI
jgi:hypothetical protein